MDVFKKILNVFGIILAVIFSIPLICSLIVAPILSGACDLVQTKNLEAIVNELDVEAIAKESLGNMGGEEAELIEIFFEEGIMGEVLDLYVEDLFAALGTTSASKQLTGEAMMAIIENHMDVFVKLAKEEMDEEMLQYVSDAEIEKMLKEALELKTQDIVDSLPSVSELGLDREVIEAIRIFREGLAKIAGIVLVTVFAVLVFICRIPRFKGFMWLGVDFVLGGGIAFVLAGSLATIVKAGTVSLPIGNEIMDPIVNVFASAVKKCGLIELGLAVLFIVIFAVGRVMLKKKAETQVA